MADLLMFKRTTLTGGGATAVDGISATALVGGELCWATVSHVKYTYQMNATSGATADGVNIIIPVVGTVGTKRWILQGTSMTTGVATTAIADNIATTQLATTAFAKSQDAVLHREPDQAVNMTAAASGSSGIMVADNANVNFGTGNFTLCWKGSLPDWTPSTDNQIIMVKWVSNVGFALGIRSTGKIYAQINIAAGDFASSSVAPEFVDGTTHEIAIVFTVGAVNTTADFYCDGVALGSQQTSANRGTVSNAADLQISGYTTTRYAGTCIHALTFNRALTAAEVLDLYRNGVSFADKWGSQTNLITAAENQSFGGGTIGNWIAQNTGGNGTCVYNAGPGAEKTALVTVGATPGTITSGNLGTGYLGSRTEYKRIRYSADIYLPAGHQFTSVIINDAGDYAGKTVLAQKDATTATVDAWQTIWIEYLLATDIVGGIFVRGASTATGDYFYFDNVKTMNIGATLALEPEGIQTDKWYDSSSNALNASYPAAGSSLTRRQKMIDDEAVAMSSKATQTTGTWTAVIKGSGTAGTYEIAAQFSNYTKIGRVVHLESRIVLAAAITGGGTGYLQITGAPFNKMANSYPMGVVFVSGVDLVGLYIVVNFITGDATAVLSIKEVNDNAAGSELPISAVAINDIIMFSITYNT